MVLRRILRRKSDSVIALHCIPAGKRVYAIGDIHGRLDLLERLLGLIRRDDQERGPADTSLIFLGDLVDRGPDSRGVVERLVRLKREGCSAIFLKGNHEEILIRARKGDSRAAALFHRVGGRETLLSYGVSAEEYDRSDLAKLITLIGSHVPPSHMAFLDSFEDFHMSGDYLFVHAGVRPRVPIEEQSSSDLRWIRSTFLEHMGSHEKMVVHGHNITSEVDEQPNRIGIDTGAFASGRLSAIGLEGGERWFLAGTSG